MCQSSWPNWDWKVQDGVTHIVVVLVLPFGWSYLILLHKVSLCVVAHHSGVSLGFLTSSWFPTVKEEGKMLDLLRPRSGTGIIFIYA